MFFHHKYSARMSIFTHRNYFFMKIKSTDKIRIINLLEFSWLELLCSFNLYNFFYFSFWIITFSWRYCFTFYFRCQLMKLSYKILFCFFRYRASFRSPYTHVAFRLIPAELEVRTWRYYFISPASTQYRQYRNIETGFQFFLLAKMMAWILPTEAIVKNTKQNYKITVLF